MSVTDISLDGLLVDVRNCSGMFETLEQNAATSINNRISGINDAFYAAALQIEEAFIQTSSLDMLRKGENQDGYFNKVEKTKNILELLETDLSTAENHVHKSQCHVIRYRKQVMEFVYQSLSSKEVAQRLEQAITNIVGAEKCIRNEYRWRTFESRSTAADIETLNAKTLKEHTMRKEQLLGINLRELCSARELVRDKRNSLTIFQGSREEIRRMEADIILLQGKCAMLRSEVESLKRSEEKILEVYDFLEQLPSMEISANQLERSLQIVKEDLSDCAVAIHEQMSRLGVVCRRVSSMHKSTLENQEHTVKVLRDFLREAEKTLRDWILDRLE